MPRPVGEVKVPLYTLPKGLPLRPLKRVFPSQFALLSSCPLRGIWSGSRVPPLLPMPPESYVGSIAHAILERAASGSITTLEKAQEAWESNVKAVEGKLSESWLEHQLVPLNTSVKYYEVKKRQCLKLAANLITSGPPRLSLWQSRRALVEKWYETPDRMVGGFIDKIVCSPEGDVIMDYKTGKFLESGTGNNQATIKEAYCDQLKLYAALYYAKHKAWPASIQVVGMDSTKYKVDFTPEECLALLDRARALLIYINDLLDEAQVIGTAVLQQRLARPSVDSCPLCLYRPACKSYWEERERDLGPGWPNDITGKVTEKRVLGNGLLLLKLDTGNKEAIIRGLHPTRHIALQGKQSKKVVAFSLKPDKGPTSFSETRLTTIYTVAL